MPRGGRLILTLSIARLMATTGVHPVAARSCRILVVMRYQEAYTWEQDIRQGIEEVLAPLCELH
jgi:hypothetical protein